ncbi:uncharacterized protein LOC107027013 [Solanum pennellii]|uniref:Uncharacterized protein LOC107027013 n=1 Tax=Solanum pennellii TaxID=28526 RepID=A0ABM1HCT9_SOLPN|nr:uncharacterized protein LOC107027013 [Solanum pennellii]
MQSDYAMGGIHQESSQMEEQPRFMVENNASTSSPFYTINPNYHFPQSHSILQQINSLPITQHFFPYQHPHYRSMSEEIRVDQSQTAELVAFPASEIRGEEDALIRGSERYCTQPRQTCVAVWQNQEDSAMKQPVWKGEYSNGNAIEKNKQEEDEELYSLEETNTPRVVFGELEAICIRGIASESVLTADDLPTNHNVTFPEAMVNKIDTMGKFHKRKRGKDEWGRFFKSLVKKLANHQEDLQRSLMETMERLDQERKQREELWREKELEKLQNEEAARAHERRLASTREAALVSCLEKLTGQKIDFQTFKIKEEENKSNLPQPEITSKYGKK